MKDDSMKDVIISIKGYQYSRSGEDSAVELVTDGLFSNDNGRVSFSYMESEITGMEGTKTTFDITPLGIIMTREGTLNSQMVFEEGKKHNFVYDTPFGSTTMGVNTSFVKTDFDEHGGDMEIDYMVDVQQSMVGRSMFKINVREQRSGPSEFTPPFGGN